MIKTIKIIILTVVILFSGIFVSILAEDNTKEDFFSKKNTKPKLISYINIIEKSYNIENIESSYSFSISSCRDIINSKLPFQKEYIFCEKKLLKVREDLI